MSTTTRETVIDCLLSIAPEADSSALAADRSLREQLDIDSFDFLNLIVAIHDRLGVSVAEADYPKVTTLDALVAYVDAHKLEART